MDLTRVLTNMYLPHSDGKFCETILEAQHLCDSLSKNASSLCKRRSATHGWPFSPIRLTLRPLTADVPWLPLLSKTR